MLLSVTFECPHCAYVNMIKIDADLSTLEDTAYYCNPEGGCDTKVFVEFDYKVNAKALRIEGHDLKT